MSARRVTTAVTLLALMVILGGMAVVGFKTLTAPLPGLPSAEETCSEAEKQVEEWNKPAPFVAVTWYPDALSLRVRRQVCRCGATHSHTEGIFLRQITKTGAQKWTQASREELEKFRGLERVQDVVEEEIPHCVSCWN